MRTENDYIRRLVTLVIGFRISERRFYLLLAILMSVLNSPEIAAAQGRPDIVWMRGGTVGLYSMIASSTGLIASSGANWLKVFDASSGLLLRTIPMPGLTRLLDFSPDGTLVAATDGKVVLLLRADNGQTVLTITPRRLGSITSASFSPNGSLLALSEGSIWRVNDGTLFREDLGGGGVVKFSPNGNFIAAEQPYYFGGFYPGALMLVNVATNTICKVTGGNYVYSLSFSPDGNLLAEGDYYGTNVYAVSGPCISNWQPARTFAVSSDSIAFSLGGTRLIAATHPQGQHGPAMFQIWNVNNWGLVGEIDLPEPLNGYVSNAVAPVQLNSGGDVFVTLQSTHYVNAIKEWTTDGVLLQQITSTMPNWLRFQPDGQHLITVGGEDYRQFQGSGESEMATSWDAATGARLRTIVPTFDSEHDGITASALSPDGRTLAIQCVSCASLPGYSSAIHLIDIQTGSRRILKDNISLITPSDASLAFSPSGDKLYWNSSLTRSLDAIDVASGVDLPPIYLGVDVDGYTLAFSPNGALFAVSDSFFGYHIEVYRVVDGANIASLPVELTRATRVLFSPDGKYLLAVGYEGPNYAPLGSIYVWNLNTGSLVYHRNAGVGVHAAVFSKDGGTFITVGVENTVRIWKTDTGEQLALYDQETEFGYGLDPKYLDIAYSPTANTFAYTRVDGSIVLARNPYGTITPPVKVTPTITWNNPADIVYDAALGSGQLNATATAIGSSVYNPAAGTVLNAGNGQTLSVTFMPTDTTHYNGASASVSINVLKAASIPSVICSAGPFTYNGSAFTPCTASVTGAGGLNQTVPVTYSNNVNAGTATASVSFAGDANHTGSGDSKTFTIGQATTATGLTTNLQTATAGRAVTFTTAVSVTIGGGAPTGTVTFKDGNMVIGTGNVNGSGLATLTTSSLALGFHTIAASYGGDSNFKASASGPLTQLIYTYTSGGGNFVIGDGNAVVGNAVTFWGSQWEKLNSLSGGAAPASFKGFANSTSSNPPTRGGNWTTDPGNSSNPPKSLPAYLAVIVTSSASKSGSVISGNVTQVVVVQTNDGYASEPGHAGTGTIVGVVAP